MRSGFNSTVKHSPPIDISEYLLSVRLAVDTLKVLSTQLPIRRGGL